uniref:Uncharacterized protein n=1 Tax=Rhizophora mucronata TaxID=61149 RepID=A0A2P2P7B1_RHIMU
MLLLCDRSWAAGDDIYGGLCVCGRLFI